MTDDIRTLRIDEFDVFETFLEGCFGHSVGFFRREYPHVHRPDTDTCRCSSVIEENGRLIAHIGVYPTVLHAAGTALSAAGIGSVCTLPDRRGQGHMGRLLRHAIRTMREQGHVLSYLGGDRRRYGAFGWENASPCYRLSFSRRSLNDGTTEGMDLRPVDPRELADIMTRLQNRRVCFADRPQLRLQLGKQDMRAWRSEDGYALVHGEDRQHLRVMEIESASGREAAMLRAMLEWTSGQSAELSVATMDERRLERLMPHVSAWQTVATTMFRVVSLYDLLAAQRPRLAQRAAVVRDFSVTLVMRDFDGDQAATISVRHGELDLVPGGAAPKSVSLDPPSIARLLLGGPCDPAAAGLPPELGMLLPLPVFLPPLDAI